MTTVIEQGDNWVLTLPKKSFQRDFLARLLEYIQLEELAQQNRMSEVEAFQIAEDIKIAWWQSNGERILAKIQPHL